MTDDERKQIVDEVLFEIRKNSKEIDELPTANNFTANDNIEVSQGRKVSAGKLAEAMFQFFIGDYLKDRYLSSETDDEAKGHIKFEKGLSVGDFVDSLMTGKGVGIFPEGRIQTRRLEVTDSMTVMDLIINEIHAMAGEYSFSDCGKIDKVDVIDVYKHTYKLWMHKEVETDITSLDVNDILLSIVNDLRIGGTTYYSSWMRCVSKNVNENSITVVLYPDTEVPGGKNHIPVKGYNVTRKGNADIPAEGDTNERAQSWFLSSKEGRLMFLTNVFKPIIEEYNYAVTVGRLPDVKPLRDLEVVGDMGIYAKTIACENFHRIDWNGDLVPNKVDRGEWSKAVAESEKPYRYRSHVRHYPDGDKYTELEQHSVWHYGCKWGCLIDKTIEEPVWNAQGWVLLEGDKNYHLDIVSTNGNSFRVNNVDTHLEVSVAYGNRDITDILMATTGHGIEWFRETSNTEEDKAWRPITDEGDKLNRIHIRREDMGVRWILGYREVAFICKVTIPVGEKFEQVEQRIRFK